MIPNHGIVLVDNEERELAQLRDAFFAAGLSCLPLIYIHDDPDNESGLDHLQVPGHTRILFVDLNLAESHSLDAQNLVGHIVNVINKVIKNETPYFLVFWSKFRDQPEQVMNLLCERFSGEICLPFAWDILSKVDYQPIGDDSEVDEKTKQRLKEDILRLLSSKPLFSAMLYWENRVSKAAKDTFETLYSLSRPNEENYSITEHNSNLASLIGRVAQESIGKRNVNAHPAHAVETGLLPVLVDKLAINHNPQDLDRLWQSSLPTLSDDIELEQHTVGKLNNFFLIEEVRADHSKTDRGVFVEIGQNTRTNSEHRKKFEKHIGRSITEILSQEFLCITGGKTSSQKKTIRDKTKLGFVEISADCDHAQRKIVLHRYILCALIPAEYHEHTCWPNPDREKAHEGIYRTSVVNISGSDYIIKLAFRYQIGTHSDNSWFGTPTFRFREQILAEIRTRASQYISRPGIICFS